MNLTHHFLVAMPNMADPHFTRTLTYLCEHNEQGALGLVVNRPMDMTLRALFEQVDIALGDHDAARLPVYFGGPVQTERGFVLHSPVGQWHSSLQVTPEIALTTSRDILEAVGEGRGPQRLLVSLGYAGWAPGQLEDELSKNAWLTVAADPKVVFDLPPEERFAAALALLGVDPVSLSDAVGHA